MKPLTGFFGFFSSSIDDIFCKGVLTWRLCLPERRRWQRDVHHKDLDLDLLFYQITVITNYYKGTSSREESSMWFLLI